MSEPSDAAKPVSDAEKAKEAEKVRKKIAMAATMLLFSSHRLPGVRGWELRKKLGRNYMKIIEMLNSKISSLGLQVKIVFEGEGDRQKPGEEDLDRARFYVTLSNILSLTDSLSAGWRIDELAALSAIISNIASRGGKAPLKEVLEVLQTKFPKWKSEASIERFIRRGYINKTEDDILFVGWRTRAEVDVSKVLQEIVKIGAAGEDRSAEENEGQQE